MNTVKDFIILLVQMMPDTPEHQIEELATILANLNTTWMPDGSISDAGCNLHSKLSGPRFTRGEKLIVRICLNAFRNDDAMPIKTQRTLNDAKSAIERLEG